MKKQIKAGIVISYLQMALGVVVGLLYTPLMIRILGQSEYGLYNTVASTISMLSILSLGFNAGYVRYYSKYRASGEEENISKLNGMFLLLFIGIGILAFSCGLFLSNHLELVFKDGLTRREYDTARILFLLLTTSLAISFPMSVFSTIISAHERFVLLKLLGIVKTVVSPLLTIPVLLYGYGSIGMVLTTVIISACVDVTYLLYCLIQLKCRFVFTGLDKCLFKDLAVYTSFIAINIIVDQINWNVDKILLARFKGTATVAVYTVGYTLYSYYQQISTSFSSLFTPQIHSIESSSLTEIEKNNVLTELMVSVGRLQLMILGLVITGFILFGNFFVVNIWAGRGFEQAYYVALLLIIPSTIALIQNVGIEIQRAKNKHQFRSIAYAIMAIINIILSIYLCKRYGAVGSAIGTAISLIIANGFIMNIYYYKACGINVILFWRSMLPIFVALCIPCVLWSVKLNYVQVSSNIDFLINIIAYTITYIISMWFLGISSQEKNSIIKRIGVKRNYK